MKKCERGKKIQSTHHLALSSLVVYHHSIWIISLFTKSDMTEDVCHCNWSSTNDEQISGGWEDMFSATVCQNLHCVQLYQPQCDPSGKRRHTITQYWQFNFTLHYWAAEWLESLRELALFCFSSVMLFIFLSKLIWNTILSTRLWKIYSKNREAVLSFTVDIYTLNVHL